MVPMVSEVPTEWAGSQIEGSRNSHSNSMKIRVINLQIGKTQEIWPKKAIKPIVMGFKNKLEFQLFLRSNKIHRRYQTCHLVQISNNNSNRSFYHHPSNNSSKIPTTSTATWEKRTRTTTMVGQHLNNNSNMLSVKFSNSNKKAMKTTTSSPNSNNLWLLKQKPNLLKYDLMKSKFQKWQTTWMLITRIKIKISSNKVSNSGSKWSSSTTNSRTQIHQTPSS